MDANTLGWELVYFHIWKDYFLYCCSAKLLFLLWEETRQRQAFGHDPPPASHPQNTKLPITCLTDELAELLSRATL